MGTADETIELNSSMASRRATKVLERALFEVKKVVVGQDRMIERLFVCLLARGHCLLEGRARAWPRPWPPRRWPARSAATSPGSSSPPTWSPPTSSAPGSTRPSTETFDIELGPIFANVVLADEINRAPAKVQSALLEVMAERHVSIGGTTYPVPTPFIVLATQNPIESEGVYPLPEAQRDRFLMKVLVDYPSAREEAEIVRRMSVAPPSAQQVLRGRRARRPPAGGRRRCSSTTPSSTTPSAWCWPPATPVEYGLPDLARLHRPRRQAPGHPRAWWPPPGRWPSCGAGTTSCPRTSTTWPGHPAPPGAPVLRGPRRRRHRRATSSNRVVRHRPRPPAGPQPGRPRPRFRLRVEERAS